MYEHFFNITETPFSIAPNPHYLYMSQQHKDALAHLIYGVGRDGGFILLTGEVGTGKTTTCRCFLEQVPEDTNVAFILNPKLEVEELLESICDELSVPYIADHLTIKDYVGFINQYLLKQHSEGRHTVLIIDEAQNLSTDVLEQIRLLTNLETHEKKLLQIILLGQPELQEMFQRPELRQLSQRVTARFHLRALLREEVGPYIYHRLKVAGSMDPRTIFSQAVVERVYHISKGIPRIINMVCDRAMLGAYAREVRAIDSEIVSGAAKEVLGYDVHSPVSSLRLDRNWVVGGITAILCCLALLFTYGYVYHGWGKGSQPLASAANAVTGLLPDRDAGLQSEQVASAEKKPLDRQNENSPAEKRHNLVQSLPEGTAEASDVIGESESVEKAAPPEEETLALITFQEVFEQSDNTKGSLAYVDLFSAWDIDFNPGKDGNSCRFAEKNGLACLSKSGSLGSVKYYGMPAILKLYGPGGDKRYITLRRLNGNNADVYVNGEVKQVDLMGLDELWRGQYSLLWKKPKSYHGPMKPGTISPLAKWLSYQLDIWEKKPEPLMGRSSYDSKLAERVKAFQRDVGESDDGVVGAGTLIQLSRRVDDAVPLLQPEVGQK